MPAIFYIWNPSRAHKLMPLLDGYHVIPIKRIGDVVRAAVKRRRGLCVMVDSFGRFGLLGLLLSWLNGMPLVLRLRGDHYREAEDTRGQMSWIRYRLGKMVTRRVLARARMVIFNSRYLESQFPLDDQHLTGVVYNPYTPLPEAGTETGGEALPEGKLKLLSVTNFDLSPKVEPLFTALQDWIDPEVLEALDIHWIILGRGHHSERLRHLIKARGLEKRIQVVGYRTEMARYYAWCDVLVHLTRMDAFPNCTLEAMAYGKPLIANANSCGTLEQIADGHNGMLVHDAASFIQALTRYDESPALRHQHGECGRQTVAKHFSIDAQQETMQQMLAKLEAQGASAEASPS